ncbi:MAG: hypothetical protein UT34_C0001G0148 [candidate division WS6 bacterium GW2011_GWF2_39_15]|uniref:Uncharacterized protein n=1 Tax=candidate division WS6 bacterium GW2011_GWF2_39_15 TaxID=1619100 RepID=A0A0G0MSJ3_9BACT|nr:MAG: hypothetical protein UT34_C0001G0148 [candidate division WS6 bacterium GW2011_GWF2_39_15]
MRKPIDLHNLLKGKIGDFRVKESVDTKKLYLPPGEYLEGRKMPHPAVTVTQKKQYMSSNYLQSGCSIVAIDYIADIKQVKIPIKEIEQIATKYGFGYYGISDSGIVDTLKDIGIESRIEYMRDGNQLSTLFPDNYLIASIWANYRKPRLAFKLDSQEWDGGHYVVFTDTFEYNNKRYFYTVDESEIDSDSRWGYSGIGINGYEHIRYTYTNQRTASINISGICLGNTTWTAGLVIVIKK